MNFMAQFGELFTRAVARQLRAAKKDRHLTEDDLAKALGIHRVSVSRYPSGTRAIPLSVLAELCRFMSIDLLELINKAQVEAAENEFRLRK